MKTADIAIELDRLKHQLIEKYRPEKIVLFGSAAQGSKEISDVDLFMIKKNVPRLGTDRLLELYRLITTDLPVDYIVYTPEEAEERIALGDPFLKAILDKGTVLYG
jgi:predicted nucleotidyltransferase